MALGVCDRAYGALTPDPRFDALHHVATAGPRAAFAFDLDYSSPAGLAATGRGAPPALQMVFRYSVLAPVQAPAAASEGGEAGAANGGHAPPAGTTGWALRLPALPVSISSSSP